MASVSGNSQQRKVKLIYSINNVFQHPTLNVQSGIPGYLAIVQENVSLSNSPVTIVPVIAELTWLQF
jgi:hypothetical protein